MASPGPRNEVLPLDTSFPGEDPKIESIDHNASVTSTAESPHPNNLRSPSLIATFNSTDYGDYVLSDEDYEKFWMEEDEEDDDGGEDEGDLMPSHNVVTEGTIFPDDPAAIRSTKNQDDAGEPPLRFRSYSHSDMLSRQIILGTASDDDMAAYADDESEKQNNKTSNTLTLSQDKKSSRLSSSLTSPKRGIHSRSTSLNAKPFLRYLRNFKVGREKRDSEDKDEEDVPVIHRVVDADSSSSSPSTPEDECDDEEEVNFIQGSAGEYDSWDESSSLELDEDLAPHAVHDWGALPPVPNKFISNQDPRDQNHTRGIPYLDADILEESEQMSKLDGNIFVWEHALLLRSVMQLLIERDHIGVEGSVDDMDNIIKRGPLKKTTFAVGKRGQKKIRATWGIKYVELRRGNLTYYGDNAKQRERKTIHLRQKEAVVQENTALDRGTDGFPFELLIQGNPPRYWMARSEEERQSWIRAIEAAMIGDETRSNRVLDLAPYQSSIDASSRLKKALTNAASKDLYINAIKQVKKELGDGQPIQLPVRWLKEQIQLATSNKEEEKKPNQMIRRNIPPDRVVKFSFQQFWKSMRQLNVSINGFEIPPSSPAAPERVVGSLTRCILEYDKANQSENHPQAASNVISELQAVSYARIILSSVLQSKKEGVVFDVIHHFLEGRNDVIRISQELEDETESATHFEVSFAGDDLPDDFFLEPDYEKDQSSWIYLARRRNKKATVPKSRWRRRYAVLSGAVLSFYEAATPRPHGLRGQFVLSNQYEVISEETSKDAHDSMLVSPRGDRRFVICISSPGEQDCLLCFESQTDMQAWQGTLEEQVQSLAASRHDLTEEVLLSSRQKNTTGMLKGAERVIKGAADSGMRVGGRVIKGATDTMKNATDGSMKAVKRATDGSMKAMRRATDSSMKVIRGAVRTFRSTGNRDEGEVPVSHARLSRVIRRATSSHLLSTATDSGKREPSVQCIVQRSSTFSIRSALARAKHYHDDGDDDEDEDDHWLTVQMTWYQAFLMSGGSSGKINSGDALIELEFVDEEEDSDDEEEYVGELEVL